jgi:glycosyltransferase involved in cell wall biosynthesis
MMKKIVFLSPDDDLKGGGELVLYEVIQEIKGHYEIYCVCRGGGDLSNALPSYGIKIISSDISWSGKVKYFPQNYLKLFLLFRKLKSISPHLIYANAGYINPFAARLAKRLKVPLVTHVHDLFDKPGKDKYCFSMSSKIITVSGAIADLVRRHNKNIKVVYNKVDPDRFSPAYRNAQDNLRNKLGLNENFVVGNVGTITYKKGYPEFIEVARILVKKIENIKFLIVGDPKRKEKHFLSEIKEKVKEYNLEDKFLFHQFTKEPQKAIASLDVLLFTSYYEGFPRVIIESFASKTPVVSSRWRGADEMISNGEDGFLFDIKDINEMAEAIIKLYNNKDLSASIVEQAHKKFMEKYTLHKMEKEVRQVIEDVISNGVKGEV